MRLKTDIHILLGLVTYLFAQEASGDDQLSISNFTDGSGPESNPEGQATSISAEDQLGRMTLSDKDQHLLEAHPSLFCGWTLWSAWSICDCQGKSCGVGVRKRARDCYDEELMVRVKPQICGGDSYEAKSCHIACPFWGDWSDWSDCSKSCGNGEKFSQRKCFGGKPGSTGCEGSDIRVAECYEKDCPKWGPWKNWCPCSVSCGNGRRTRSRDCIGADPGHENCQGENMEFADCNNGPCPEWGNWGSWSECSVDCGVGKETRTRICERGVPGEDCLGNTIEERRCGQPCPIWTNWSSYSRCSEPCGDGTKSRQRQCQYGLAGIDCPGPANEISDCNDGPCPFWGPFNKVNNLCRTEKPRCGPGKTQLRRVCHHGIAGRAFPFGCPGSPSALEDCKIDCNWTKWGAWSDCNVKLGKGQVFRSRYCQGGYPGDVGCEGPQKEVDECIVAQWSSWSSWSECPTECGEAKVSRTRFCQFGDIGIDCLGEASETKSCSKCCWDDWGEWSGCSVEKGHGTCYRERGCLFGEVGICCRGMSRQNRRCFKPYWSDWSDWSKCACGHSTQFRKKICYNNGNDNLVCPEESSYEERKCYTPVWAEWSDWICTAKRGIGQATRTRECVDGKPGQGCCQGRNLESETCHDPYWSEWTDWSNCNVDRCGKGEIYRTRQCLFGQVGKDCIGDNKQVKTCEKNCEWAEWSSFSRCIVRTRNGLGEGLMRRNRQCNGGYPGDIGCEGENLNDGTCKIDGWSNWGPWSDCSVDCGHGEIVRKRECQFGVIGQGNCQGASEQVKKCTKCCWSDWTSWTDCNVNCGWGSRQQTRTCNYGREGSEGCPGKSLRAEKCWTKACLSDWRQWEKCQGDCGIGAQSRFRKCTGSDGNHSDECNVPLQETQKCNLNCPCKQWSDWGEFTGCPKCWDHEIWTLAGWKENPTPPMTRRRQCLGCRGICEGPSTQTEQCPCDNPCSQWQDWGQWSTCPVCSDDRDTKIYQKRSRTCTGRNCKGHNIMKKLCPECPVCSKFNDWSSWSDCPYCDDNQARDHFMTRTRTCNGVLGKGDCQGPIRDSIKCENVKRCSFYKSWSDWTPCPDCTDSITPIFTTRNRVCQGNNCLGPNLQSETCPKVKRCSQWNEWQKWSSCPRCDDFNRQHFKKRSRTCDGKACLGVNQESELCGKLPRCSFWQEWSEWSECPYCRDTTLQVTYTKSRSRKCSGENCLGSAVENESCGLLEPCARMGSWTTWEECPKCCFKGKEQPFIRRSRPCIVGNCPRSGMFEERQCQLEFCEVEGKYLFMIIENVSACNHKIS